MSILSTIINDYASRHTERAKEKQQWESAVLSSNQIRSRRFRRILAFCLILAATIAFVEVVLLPAKLVRRNLTQTPVASTSTDDDRFSFPSIFMSEGQKAELRQKRLDRIEQEIRHTQQELGNARADLDRDFRDFEKYVKNKLHINVLLKARDGLPPSLVEVTAHEPTAQLAWDRILETAVQTDARLRDADGLLERVGARFSVGSFLAEDDQAMRGTIENLQQNQLSLNQLRICADHIAILQRARAALAHQSSLETLKGESE